MLTIDDIAAMPSAGRALLVAHRWLAAHPKTAGATAFDLLGAVLLTQPGATGDDLPALGLLEGMSLVGLGEDQVRAVVDAIADGDNRSKALLSISLSVWAYVEAVRMLRAGGAGPDVLLELHRQQAETVRQLKLRFPFFFDHGGKPAEGGH